MFKSVTLEVSLKPFRQTDEDSLRAVVREIFTAWRPLLNNREEISLMLWVGDGSEILDYRGEPDDPFEWGYWVGTANKPEHDPQTDSPAESLHVRKRKYTDAPAVFTYRILRDLVRIIKEEGRRSYPASRVAVGETMDIGPEFAVSDFKYSRHREILNLRSGVDSLGFIDAVAEMKEDRYPYAAYPDGVPDGTPFGTFFGKQLNIFFADMGFDYVWLSNGLGFSADPWKLTGKIYDGERFYPERLPVTREKVFAFWKLLRDACPDIPVRTRGTNNSVGIDYATDGVPLSDIYRADFGILPPPNSPWAALNNNYGLEMIGQMTRNAELPGDDFMFRYYIHDPWWMNSPWYDRYEGGAGDIYLPMAVSRIDDSGRTHSAGFFHILSIDNSLGGMPDACVNEPIPHILKAEKDAPDEPAPLVWVYPFREYTTADDGTLLSEMYHGDRFIMDAVNDGFPLCCVTSTGSFLKQDLSVYRASILLTPVPCGQDRDALSDRLRVFSENGGRILLYGSERMKRDASALLELPGLQWIDIGGDASALRLALEVWGIGIRFLQREDSPKPPTMAFYRSDHALMLSLYNADTTTDTMLRTPLGAPVPLGTDTEIRDDTAILRFSRCEHREIRFFVRQKDGVVTAQEAQPVSGYYRRKIVIRGLRDAEVVFFPENRLADRCDVQKGVNQDAAPAFTDDFRLVRDPVCGIYYRAEHVSGSYTMMLPFEKPLL